MKFEDLEIHPDLKKAVLDAGFETLTEIQEKCFDPGTNGRDIAGVSQTGTGKTVAFLLPILKKITEAKITGVSSIIVSPTRELCLQISEEVEKLCKYTDIKSVAIYGGEDYKHQEKKLADNPSIIVATPGRLIDFMKQKKIKTDTVEFLVLDEADRMLDMGFIRDIGYIMKRVPKESQVFLFSATLSYYILRIASDFMKNPVEIRIESDSVAVDKIEQSLYHLSRDEKNVYMLNQILSLENPKIIVFTNYKHAIERIVRYLHKFGISAVGISSLLDQKKRIRLLKSFKSNQYSVLVATDVASRGLDVDDITHVINYDLPQDAESYVHRIGRTARAGKSGVSFAYCSEDDYENLPRIQRYMDQKIPVADVVSAWVQIPEGHFTYFKDPEKIKKTQGNKHTQNNQSNSRSHKKKDQTKRKKTHHSKDDKFMSIREKDRARALGLLTEPESSSFESEEENKRVPKKRKERSQKNKKKYNSRSTTKDNQRNRAQGANVKRHTIKTLRNNSEKKKGVIEKIKLFFKKSS